MLSRCCRKEISVICDYYTCLNCGRPCDMIVISTIHEIGINEMEIENGMDAEKKIKLKNLLLKHEGEERFPYIDPEGNIFIGICRNLSDTGLRKDEIDLLFKNDTDFLYDYLLKNYSWFKELNEARQIALVDMAFIGIKNFESFKKMIDALSNHDYKKAHDEILDSSYSKKLLMRGVTKANDIANVILMGEI